jgi:hypothetical protein
MPEWRAPRTEWVDADVARDDLRPLFEAADVVIHLAWLIRSSRAATTPSSSGQRRRLSPRTRGSC